MTNLRCKAISAMLTKALRLENLFVLNSTVLEVSTAHDIKSNKA